MVTSGMGIFLFSLWLELRLQLWSFLNSFLLVC